jgi:hypothetical protein
VKVKKNKKIEDFVNKKLEIVIVIIKEKKV